MNAVFQWICCINAFDDVQSRGTACGLCFVAVCLKIAAYSSLKYGAAFVMIGTTLNGVVVEGHLHETRVLKSCFFVPGIPLLLSFARVDDTEPLVEQASIYVSL